MHLHWGFRSFASIVDLSQFKFYEEADHRGMLMDGEDDLVPSDLFRAHINLFFNECRTYGRPVEAGQNGKIVVRCYGHMSIPADKEAELARRFDFQTWHRPEEDYAKPISERQPFRAIVKEMVREQVPLTPKVVNKMLKDLKTMRELSF